MTLEEIKEQYAKSQGYNSYGDLAFSGNYYSKYSDIEDTTNELMVRFAQSQTQALTKQYEDLELSNTLLKDQIIHLQNDLGYRKILLEQRVEQNRELVEMLEYIFYKTNFQNHFPTTSIKVKNLLSKHNHLK